MPESRFRRFAGTLFFSILPLALMIFYGFREIRSSKRSGNLVFTVPHAGHLRQIEGAWHVGARSQADMGACRVNPQGRRDRWTCPVVEDTFVLPWNPSQATGVARLDNPTRCQQERWTIEPAEDDITVEPNQGDGCSYGWTIRRTWPGRSINGMF